MITLLLILNLADGAAFPGTWKGRISDLKCGASMTDGKCIRRCLDEGQAAVLVEDETGEIRSIANADSVKNYAGEHVEIKGTTKDGLISVRSVKPLDK